MAVLKSDSPVSREEKCALPVKEIAPAIAYYQSVLGFTVVSRDDSNAVIERDQASDHDPHEAGSLGFEVDDLDALQAEPSGRGGKPGKLDSQEWGGRKHRVFFAREDENDYCFCFDCPVSEHFPHPSC